MKTTLAALLALAACGGTTGVDLSQPDAGADGGADGGSDAGAGDAGPTCPPEDYAIGTVGCMGYTCCPGLVCAWDAKVADYSCQNPPDAGPACLPPGTTRCDVIAAYCCPGTSCQSVPAIGDYECLALDAGAVDAGDAGPPPACMPALSACSCTRPSANIDGGHFCEEAETPSCCDFHQCFQPDDGGAYCAP